MYPSLGGSRHIRHGRRSVRLPSSVTVHRRRHRRTECTRMCSTLRHSRTPPRCVEVDIQHAIKFSLQTLVTQVSPPLVDLLPYFKTSNSSSMYSSSRSEDPFPEPFSTDSKHFPRSRKTLFENEEARTRSLLPHDSQSYYFSFPHRSPAATIGTPFVRARFSHACPTYNPG